MEYWKGNQKTVALKKKQTSDLKVNAFTLHISTIFLVSCYLIFTKYFFIFSQEFLVAESVLLLLP